MIMKDEKKVLNHVSDGDERAFQALFDHYRAKVYTYALKIVKCEDQAEDILQDVFLKVWQHQNLGDIVNFEGYLRTMTKNHVLKFFRRQQLEQQNSNKLRNEWSEAHNETEECLLLHDSQHLINEAIAHLPPKQKLVYDLCKNQGLKYEAAAKILSVSPLTVKTHMQHSLRFVRKYLSKYTDIANIFLALQCLL